MNIRKLCDTIVNYRFFDPFIISVILFNAITIGLETSQSLVASYGWFFDAVNLVALIIFIFEAALKLTAVAPTFSKYFKNPWNDFDFLIIIFALIPATGSFATVARLARILRVLRLVTKLKGLKVMVSTLLRSIPGIGNVLLLLSIIFYIYGIMGYQIFHEVDPTHWGTLGLSILTLFRIATLDSWSEVMYIAIENNPYSWIFFISFVLIGGLTVINLFIGVVLLNIGEAHKETHANSLATKEDIHKELQSVKTALINLEKKIGE